MKVNALDYKFNVVVFIFFSVFGAFFSVKGDIGGGSGKAISPYVPDKKVLLEEIVSMKNFSTKNRFIQQFSLKETTAPQYVEKVGLYYAKDEIVSDEIIFEFNGITETGEKMNIDFSEVKSFSLIEIDNRLFSKDRALLQIILFPHISAEQLFSIQPQPSYSELKDNFTKIVKLWVNIEDEEDNELCIVGVRWADKYENLCKLRDLKLNSEIILVSLIILLFCLKNHYLKIHISYIRSSIR